MNYSDCNILVIDDNEDILTAITLLLETEFTTILKSTRPDEIRSIFKTSSPELVLLDMNFSAGVNSGNEGLYWLDQILKIDPNTSVILMTAYADLELAVRGINAGAIDFIEKPWDDDKLLTAIKNALRMRHSEHQVQRLELEKHQLQEDLFHSYEFVIGQSKEMLKLEKLISKVANTDANILILGENGTGKELVAREIHRRSARKDTTFVTTDLSSIPETLLESELFGHKKGTFTGATADRLGRFELAEGGTLFLDEIGNLPLSKQVKLLQVLQERVVMPLGASLPISLDFRLISATNRPLEAMIEKGTFREDLFFRLNTVTLTCPPLRERLNDIPELLVYFITQYKHKYHKPTLTFDSGLIDHLSMHSWPGNIRELDHATERAVILCEGDAISAQDFELNQNPRESVITTNSFNLAENEWKLIQDAISSSKGNISKAAKLLGITRRTLYNKLEKYGPK
ncbi:sigma-54-dependent Fis family transcriptional regulator [bacterium]|nr:sigma-54-dependent Fis family transcriptional regulator [bacterium]